MNRSSNVRKATARADKIRVLIADDHTTFLAGLTSIIDMERDMIVIAQATDGRQAADLWRKHRPNVMLLDLRMPVMDAAEKFWSPNYIQHSAHIGPGREGLFDLIKNLPATLKWMHGVILAEDDSVIVHSRYSGHGLPAPWIVADIVRMENGVLAEHWDVIQDEATKEESKSGLPMFGTSFPKPDQQPAAAPLTIMEARTIVAPLYDALNQPSTKDVAALLAKAAHSDYRSYHTNEDFLTRDQLTDVFKNLGSTVPDLCWEIKDIKTIGDQVVVRGEATGTPKGEFWGAKPTGKGFKTMALDIFTVKNGKLASAYHVENWMAALQQISK